MLLFSEDPAEQLRQRQMQPCKHAALPAFPQKAVQLHADEPDIDTGIEPDQDHDDTGQRAVDIVVVRQDGEREYSSPTKKSRNGKMK